VAGAPPLLAGAGFAEMGRHVPDDARLGRRPGTDHDRPPDQRGRDRPPRPAGARRMTQNPTAAELIGAVIGFIEQRAAPQLKDRDAFLAKVAVNALAAVKREIELGPQARAEATARLIALLGHDGDFADLNAELCERLA